MTKATVEGGSDLKPKAKKKHLHKIVTERITDEKGKDKGFVHHHVYKDSHDSPMEHPARPMGTSGDPAEAGEHVADQFGAAGAGPNEEEEAGAGAAPPAAAGPPPEEE